MSPLVLGMRRSPDLRRMAEKYSTAQSTFGTNPISSLQTPTWDMGRRQEKIVVTSTQVLNDSPLEIKKIFRRGQEKV